MTERERMSSGEPFFTGDRQLMQDKCLARTLSEEYNRTSEAESERRLELLHRLFGSVGDGIFIKPPFHCDYGYNISVGDNFFANFDCVFLDAAPIRIGNNCMIGPKTCIYAIGHPLDPAERRRGIGLPDPVTVGNDVWIGGGVTILPGVTIGDGSVIGAGSVVTHDVPPHTLVAGNPARIIRELSVSDESETSDVRSSDCK